MTQRPIGAGVRRRVLGYARPYTKIIAIFLALVVAESALSVAAPLLFRQIIDKGVIPGNKTVVVTFSLVVAGVALLSAALGLLDRWMSARIGEGLIFDLRTQVFSHVLRQPVAFFTRSQTGALVSRLNNDVIGAQQAFTSTLSSLVSNVVSLVLVTTAMVYLAWPIALITLAMFPLFLWPARRFGAKLAGLSREAMTLNAELGSRMTERFNVAGILLVKLFGSLRTEDSEYATRAGRVRDIGVTIAMNNKIFFTSLTLVASLATAMVYGVGGLLSVGGSMSVGTLVALTALLGGLYGPLTALSNVRVDIMTALVSFDRVFEVLDLAPAIQERPDAVALSRGPQDVVLDDVHFTYPSASEVSLASLEVASGKAADESGAGDREQGDEVLHGISLQVPAGTMLALVGPSGAGKTTVTGLMARLFDPTSGSVRIGGHDLRDVSLESLREAVGVVTQEAHMFHDTIRANLAYAKPDATDEEMIAALREAHVWDTVTGLRAGLDTVVGDRGHRLSGGEKQRLALARLLLKAPGIVILDEATAHLDSESEAAIQAALERTLTGRTAIVIAHRLSTVRAADQIAVIDQGRVVELGTHSELLAAAGLYAQLYATQFQEQDQEQEAPLL